MDQLTPDKVNFFSASIAALAAFLAAWILLDSVIGSLGLSMVTAVFIGVLAYWNARDRFARGVGIFVFSTAVITLKTLYDMLS